MHLRAIIAIWWMEITEPVQVYLLGRWQAWGQKHRRFRQEWGFCYCPYSVIFIISFANSILHIGNFFVHYCTITYNTEVLVQYREGGIYGVYSPRGRAASEGCIRHKSRLSRYLTNLFYFWEDFLAESFDFKQFKSRFFHKFDLIIYSRTVSEIQPGGTSEKTDSEIK